VVTKGYGFCTQMLKIRQENQAQYRINLYDAQDHDPLWSNTATGRMICLAGIEIWRHRRFVLLVVIDREEKL
jgi:hypothetical protein